MHEIRVNYDFQKYTTVLISAVYHDFCIIIYFILFFTLYFWSVMKALHNKLEQPVLSSFSLSLSLSLEKVCASIFTFNTPLVQKCCSANKTHKMHNTMQKERKGIHIQEAALSDFREVFFFSCGDLWSSRCIL